MLARTSYRTKQERVVEARFKHCATCGQAMDGLPEILRHLTYDHNLTSNEVGRVLLVSRGTVATWLLRHGLNKAELARQRAEAMEA